MHTSSVGFTVEYYLFNNLKFVPKLLLCVEGGLLVSFFESIEQRMHFARREDYLIIL